MFEKKATTAHKMQCEALYVPKTQDWEIFNTSRIKVASIDKSQPLDIGGFDLEAAIKDHPDHLFVKVFAIKKDEVNDNGDAFSESELKRAAHTFVGVPVFVNHQNDDIEKARGKVVHAWYDDAAGGIYTINMVDRSAYPRLARGIEESYITGCFPPDAPVLMADGTEKSIIDIESGDSVISGQGNICKVLGKRQRAYNYPLFSIKVEGIDNPLVCTSNHNIMVYRLPKECACGCQMALSECADKRITSSNFKKIFRQGHNPRGIAFKHEYIQKIRACEIEDGDFLIEPKYANNSNSDISEDQAFLIGLFAAEGSFEKRDGIRHSVIFNFSHLEHLTLAKKCSDLLLKVFPNKENAPTINYYPGSSQTRVCFYGKDVAEFFYKYCGEYSDSKKFDKTILDLDLNTTSALLAGHLEGDGCNIRGKTYSITSVSKNLISQLRLLYSKIGVRTQFRRRKITTGYKAKTGGYTTAFEISFGITTAEQLREKLLFKKADEPQYKRASFHGLKDIVIRKIKKIEELDYDGVVYDIEVENDHTYCVNHLAVSNTSMGAQVGYSLCSICHNKASTADEFCDHIKHRKNKKTSGHMNCSYHKSPAKPTDPCSVCGCKKGESKEFQLKEAQVFEWNFDIKFIEDSFVVNPACHDCLVCDILNVPTVEMKVANLKTTLQKIAESYSEEGKQIKVAGKNEINDLNDAMNKLERVTRSMMAQKKQVSLEYVSDIVEALADIQSITNELIEMGYPQLQSPPESEVLYGSGQPASPLGQEAQQADPSSMPPAQPQQAAPSPGEPSSGSLGGDVGTVTRPTFSFTSEKEFLKTATNIRERVRAISDGLGNTLNVLKVWREAMSESTSQGVYKASAGNISVVIASDEALGDGLHVAKLVNNKVVSIVNSSEFDEEMRSLMASKPQEAAERILKEFTKESGNTMADNNTKKVEAAGKGVEPSQTEVITQKQLDAANLPLHPRTGVEKETITEGNDQLGGKPDIHDVKLETPQVRLGTYDVITEVQLASIKEGYLTRWNEFPEVITEKQWDQMTEAIVPVRHGTDFGALKGDYTEEITQGQLLNLRNDHHWTDPEFITEVQLKDQKASFDGGRGEIGRWKGASTDSKKIIKAALDTVSDAIANYGLTPSDVSRSVSAMMATPQSQLKAMYLTLVNSAPGKSEARKAERSRNSYFGKKASEGWKPLDSMLAAMSDNIGYLKGDNFLNAIRFVVSDQKAFAQAENDAQVKIASASVDSDLPVIDETQSLRNAFAEVTRPEDGIYKIQGVIKDDLGADPKDRELFMAAVSKFAASQIDVPAVVMKVNLGKNASGEFETFEVIAKDKGKLTPDEKIASEQVTNKQVKTAEKTASRSSNREQLIKEAQMMGGQMGGGMGGGGGGGPSGASLPTPPGDPSAGAAGQPPVESFGQEPGAPMDEMGGGGEDMTAKPPGSICPVCGSEDVDIVAGKGKCNNCSSEFIFKVNVEVLKWSGLTDDGEGEGMGEEGEGFPMPEDTEGMGGAAGGAPEGPDMGGQVPVAAMTVLKPFALKKIAESKLELGRISPVTGSSNTIKLDKNEFFCLDTGTKYVVHTAHDTNTKKVYAEWRWIPKFENHDCPSCQRAKNTLAKAIKSYGLNEEQFDKLSFREKGKVIIALHDKGLLKQVKIASKTGSIIEDYKKAYSVGDKFPIESCREKLARRFGENALALSGPCEGDNLADCVCQKLKSAGIYSDGLAVKVASAWSDCDGSIECIEDYVRSGLTMKHAATVCDALKTRYAQFTDMLADDIDSSAAMNDPAAGNAGMGGLGGAGAPGSMPGGMGDAAGEDSLFDSDVDPFAGAETPGEESAEEAAMSDGAVPPGADAGAADPLAGTESPAEEMAEHGDIGGDLAGGAPGAPGAGGPIQVDLDISVVTDLVNSVKDALDKVNGGGVGGDLGGEMGSDLGGGMPQPDLGSPVPGGDEIPTDNGAGINGADGGEAPIEDSAGGSGSLLGGLPGAGSVEEVVIEVPTAHNDSAEGVHDDKGNVSHDESHDESNGDVHIPGENEEKKEEKDEEKEDSKPDFLNKEGDEDEDPIMTEAESLGKNFKMGRIASTGSSNLDLSNVIKLLNKKADGATFAPVQDDADTKPYSSPEKSTIGHEPTFKADNPDAPTGKATIGKESPDLQKFDNPDVHTGNAEMGHEKEQGYTSEKSNKGTGGVDGAGTSKAASRMNQNIKTKDMTNGLVDRLVQASETKLEEPKPVSEDKDIGEFSNNKDHSNTPEEMKRKPFAEGEKPEVPEGDGKAFIGHEEESIGDIPKAGKNAPNYPAGGGRDTSKFDKNEKNAPEKMNKDKGTVIAKSNEESNKAKNDAAFKLAGIMLQRNLIQATQLADEVDKLKKYDLDHIKMLEKTINASAGSKGLDTASNGVETPMIVPETSNQKKTASAELSNKLTEMFTLSKRLKQAEDDPNIEAARLYGR